MKFSTPRRVISSLLIFCQISLSCLSLFATTAAAQSRDTEPPTITFDEVEETRKGDSQVFTVTAADNVGVDSLEFFYRFGSDQQYAISVMRRIGGTDLFTFTLQADDIPERADVIQYYLEAKDEEGNRTLRGFSFDPLERVLLAGSATGLAGTEQAKPDSSSLLGSLSTTEKILYGALGVVIVGALVAAAGSGGDDDGGGSGASGVPVTITVDPLIVN